MINYKKILTPRNIAAFILVLMCITYIPLETRAGVSPVKTIVSALAIPILVFYSPKISKAIFLGFLYWGVVVFAAHLASDYMRWSTLLYLASIIGLFGCYYNLVYLQKVFSIDYYISFLKRFILAYTILLLIQQFLLIIGIKLFPILNLCQILDRGIGANSLASEPSVTARIMCVLFLSLLRMYEVKWGKDKVNIKAIYTDAKWVVIGFLWSMLTMGSGTAFVCLAVLCLYFIKRQYAFFITPLIIVLYISTPYIDFEPYQRAVNIVEASLTLDNETIRKTDGSASTRIVPIINTLSLDLSKKESWIGHGVDYGRNNMEERYMGEITDYGLISYLAAMVFVFACCIRFRSIEAFMFFIGIGGGTGNIAYLWGILMIFTTTNFFYKNTKDSRIKAV